MYKLYKNKLLILFLLTAFLVSCSSVKHRKKKKCNDCPTFSYHLNIKNDRI